jgi:hypothetical protein
VSDDEVSRIIHQAEVAEPADAADSKNEPTSKETGKSPNPGGSGHEWQREEPPTGQSAGNEAAVDVVEAALADALRRAAEAGAFDAVAALTAELKARREARDGVVSLGAERARRGGKA